MCTQSVVQIVLQFFSSSQIWIGIDRFLIEYNNERNCKWQFNRQWWIDSVRPTENRPTIHWPGVVIVCVCVGKVAPLDPIGNGVNVSILFWYVHSSRMWMLATVCLIMTHDRFGQISLGEKWALSPERTRIIIIIIMKYKKQAKVFLLEGVVSFFFLFLSSYLSTNH